MRNNQKTSRFELETDRLITFANYQIKNKILYIDYVEAPQELRGKGVAGKLMQEICEFAKKENLKITPICSYAVVWMQRHKEYQNLIS